VTVPLAFLVADSADVHRAVTGVMASPIVAGASTVDRSLVGTIVSELGTNIVKYAERGRILCSRVEEGSTVFVEVCAEDRGPGIPDVAAALGDHFSTGATLGLGLPGVRRMADTFRIEAVEPTGTRVAVRKRIRGPAVPPVWSSERAQAPRPRPSRLGIGTHVRPLPGEVYCGDRVMVVERDEITLVVLMDATGHGARAAAVCDQVTMHLSRSAVLPLTTLFDDLGRLLQGDVGAAVGALVLELGAHRFWYAGVGNSGVARVLGDPWRGISRDGVVGGRPVRVAVQEGVLRPGDRFVLWTDGISERELLHGSPLCTSRGAPEVLAQEMVALCGRAHDDAGIAVVEWRE